MKKKVGVRDRTIPFSVSATVTEQSDVEHVSHLRSLDLLLG